jgi:D-xylose transport system ATP-binding protein
MDMGDIALEMLHITKDFPGVRALNDVSLEICRGEIHALVGENGAGKSTLIKILSGAYPFRTYGGKVFVNGKLEKFSSARDAVDAGIAVIYQELELVKDLNVAENIFLGRLHSRMGVIDWRRIYHEASKLLDFIGVNIELTSKIKDIGIGKQQLVEIAKALSLNADILILDEPTAALTESEVKLLMKILRHLRSKGVTCILISHKLNEVLEIADRITVLRDGEKVGTDVIVNFNEDRLIKMMAGRTLTQMYPTRDSKIGKVVLEVNNFSKKLAGSKTSEILNNISFSVHAGEILGVSGLMGAGRTELLMSLFGFLKGDTKGTIKINDQFVRLNTPRDAIKSGIGIVTEDRKQLGLILKESVARNAMLASDDKVSISGILSEDREAYHTKRLVEELGIKTPSVKTKVNTLSGGNQQKVLLARCLMTNPKVIFFDEPTRGIDVGAKHEIYVLMNKLSAMGTAIIMVSSELPEIMGMSDRILVMHEGKVAGLFTRNEATQEKIMALASGGLNK